MRLTLGVGHRPSISLAGQLERLAMYPGRPANAVADRGSPFTSTWIPTWCPRPFRRCAPAARRKRADTRAGATEQPGAPRSKSQRRADWLVLSVEDDGAGLPPAGDVREGTGIGKCARGSRRCSETTTGCEVSQQARGCAGGCRSGRRCGIVSRCLGARPALILPLAEPGHPPGGGSRRSAGHMTRRPRCATHDRRPR